MIKVNKFLILIIVFTGLKIKIGEERYDIHTVEKITNFTYKKLINQIKSTFCISCEKSINNSLMMYELPCKCVLCTPNCIKRHFELTLPNHLDKKLNSIDIFNF